MKFSVNFLEKIYQFLSKDEKKDGIKWNCRWELIKYKDKNNYKKNNYYEKIPVMGNMLLTVGAEEIWNIVAGVQGHNPYSYANTYIGVGNSNVAVSANQIGLQGGTTAYGRLEVGFPIINNNEITFQTTFDADEANFHWNEMSIINGTMETGVSLNRKVYDLGTKEGGVWSLRAIISLN